MAWRRDAIPVQGRAVRGEGREERLRWRWIKIFPLPSPSLLFFLLVLVFYFSSTALLLARIADDPARSDRYWQGKARRTRHKSFALVLE